MPTHDEEEQFIREYAALTKREQDAFRDAVRKMVVDLRTGQGFRATLRVKGLRRRRGVYEMTWAPDGRALFRYGKAKRNSDPHIIWLSIGTHEILDR